MKGCFASRAAVLFAALAVGACVVLPLCSSVHVSAAGNSKSLRGKDGSEVATGVAGSGHDAKSPQGTSDETSQSRSASGRKTSVVRWRSSSTGFLKRFGKGPKFLLSMSAIIATALLFSQVGNVLLRCLADMEGQQKPPSEGPESEACKGLREWSENEGQKHGATGLAKLLPSGLRASIPERMVMTVALLSLIAIALANPAGRMGSSSVTPDDGHVEDEDGSLVTTPSGGSHGTLEMSLPTGSVTAPDSSQDDDDLEDEDDLASGFGSGLWGDEDIEGIANSGNITLETIERATLEPEDGTPPTVTIESTNATIGDKWVDKNGEDKTGSEEAIVHLAYEGMSIKARLSRFTENALKRDGLLQEVKRVLSAEPKKEGETLIWGEVSDETVLCIEDKDDTVPFKLYLPKGAFGLVDEASVPREDEHQGWFDIWITAFDMLYVAKTGKIPPPPPTVPPAGP